MPWTDAPPTEPGRYRLRLKAAPGIDQTPLEVELRDDTVNPGGLCVRDQHGLWHRLGAMYPRESVEGWRAGACAGQRVRGPWRNENRCPGTGTEDRPCAGLS